MKKLILLGLAAVFLGNAHGQTTAITNAEVHTVSGDIIANGTVVIQDGLISAVGPDVVVPDGARIIDGTGKVVTPGFVSSNSQLGLTEIGSTASTRDATTSEKDLGASFKPVWGVNPENTHIPVVRLRGVTSTVVVPGGSQLFTGQSSVIALDGETIDEMIRRETAAIYTAMGESGSSRAGGSRAANYQRLHDALWDARAKTLSAAAEKAKAVEENSRKRKKKNDDAKASTEEDPKLKGGRSSLNDRNLEALQEIVSGDMPLVVTAHRVSDLRLALSLQSEFDINLVIMGGSEAWRVADELQAANVAVMVNSTRDLPRFDGLSATLKNAGLLQVAGVEVLLTGGRDLAHRAGLAVANGMDHSAALRAVTLGPAIVWGIEDIMGSLDEGKIADVVVWSGDPFELSSSAEMIFVAGREIPEDSRQERLFDRYKNLDEFKRNSQ